MTFAEDVLGYVIEARRQVGQGVRTYLAARKDASPTAAGLWSLGERYAEGWARRAGDLGGVSAGLR